MTDDSHLFKTEPGKGRFPILFRAAMVGLKKGEGWSGQ
jgi:hypothetical protein